MTTIPEQVHTESTETGCCEQLTGIGSSVARQHRVNAHECGEGPLARAIESQTAKLPSDTWLWAAGGSILLSLALQAQGEKHKALFVGNWAPTLLLLGIYNKMVKLHGSE